MPDVDRTLELVRKLLAKAEDPACTPAEAEAFTAKAAELIAVYGIDRAALAATDPNTDALDRRQILCEPPYALDKSSLLARVSGPLRLRAVRTTTGNRAVSMELFGYQSDLDRAELLYTSLLVQASYGLAGARPDPDHFWREPTATQIAAYRRSWLDGFSLAIGQRLTVAENRARQEHENRTGSGMELVLVDRSTRVDRMVEDAYPKLRSARRRSLTGDGHNSGFSAGKRADLGTPSLGRTTKPSH
jgi:hypothetical protein